MWTRPTSTSLLVTLTARPDGNAVESLSLNAAATAAASGAGLTVSYTPATGAALDHGLGHDGGVPIDPAGHSVQRQATPDHANRSITVVANDGAVNSATQTVTLTGTAVNDAPTATNLSAAESYTEDTALNLIDIVVSDVDSANVTATLTLSNVAAGSLNTGTSGAVTSTFVGRGVDRQRRDRRCQHLARGRDLHPGPELQQQLHHRHQRERRRGPRDHRRQGHDRHRGQRCAHRHQPECRGELHRRHRAQPDRHRGRATWTAPT